MPLPNRVAPDGSLHGVPARGLFTGNRGIIHDPALKAPNGRNWTTKSWIVCNCAWKGRKRDVWGYQNSGYRAGWSELFFLDEVTALAAGHRPCFHCRREKAKDFAAAFAIGNGLDTIKAPDMDLRLHGERLLSSRKPPLPLSCEAIEALPDGVVILEETTAGPRFHAMRDGAALAWSFAGYEERRRIRELCDGSPAQRIRLVTPASTVAALKGETRYRPVWHDSSGPRAGS